MKKNWVSVFFLFSMVLALALALGGCPTEAGESSSPDLNAEDFGAGAVVTNTYTVRTATELATAITAIKDGGNNKNYIITIADDFETDARFNIYSDTDPFKGKVSIRGTGTITLTGNTQGTLLTIREDQTITLRGPTLTRSDSVTAPSPTQVVDVRNTGIFKMRSGTVDANQKGLGIYVAPSGRFEMSGGTVKNATGMGVLPEGTFEMSGGSISGNSGSGVHIIEVNTGSAGTFTMSGGTISGNNGSAVDVDNPNSAFTMTGGTLSGNSGSGVNFQGTFIMKGGTISGNGAEGIYTKDAGGTFTMEGGTISGNKRTGVVIQGDSTMKGGKISRNGQHGVVIDKTTGITFTMKGGTISDNDENGVNLANGDYTFTMEGGTISGHGQHGVNVDQAASFTMKGGTISNNSQRGVNVRGTFNMQDGTISGNGRGVNVERPNSIDAVFNMSGGTITGNVRRGVHVQGAFTMTGGTITGNRQTGVWIHWDGKFDLNTPATKASISGNTEGQVTFISNDSGYFKVNGVNTLAY
jgi:hypothetical protein